MFPGLTPFVLAQISKYDEYAAALPHQHYGQSTDIVPLIREAAAYSRSLGKKACLTVILTDGQTNDANAALVALQQAQDTYSLFAVYGFGRFLAKGSAARAEMVALDDRVNKMKRNGWDSWQLSVESDFFPVLQHGAVMTDEMFEAAVRDAVCECVAELPKQLRFLDDRRRQ